MRIQYPPVGMAHLTKCVPDLLTDRIAGASRLQVACVMQPKSHPHFGTMAVVLGAFALAEECKRKFNLDTSVLIDVLENSPNVELQIGGRTFAKALSHCEIDGESAVAHNMRQVLELARWSVEQTGINFSTRTYREIQAQAGFRSGLRSMINRRAEFTPICSPSEGTLKIRPLCIKCGLMDKGASETAFSQVGDNIIVSNVCPLHGTIDIPIDDANQVIDTNAPIRTILRSLCFIMEREGACVETLVVNGADWAGPWMQRVYGDGLAALGYAGTKVPLNLFIPQILDDTGAKLSKTIYLESGAYADIPQHWLTVGGFLERFGERGLERLWIEIVSWAREPKKLFRNYTISYLERVFVGL